MAVSANYGLIMGPDIEFYFKRIKKDTFMLLCGGTKASQAKDIASAKSIADLLEE